MPQVAEPENCVQGCKVNGMNQPINGAGQVVVMLRNLVGNDLAGMAWDKFLNFIPTPTHRPTQNTEVV